LEPDKKIVSKSGDNCIVANLDQWHIKCNNCPKEILEHLNKLKVKPDELIKDIKNLKKRSCTRQCGFGPTFPETDLSIDPISDLVFCASYHVFSHFLQNNIYGIENKTKPLEKMDEFWDSMLTDIKCYPEYEKIKEEFKYWIPIDMVICDKSLSRTYLPMLYYNHNFMYQNDIKLYPQECLTSGNILINGKVGVSIKIEDALSREKVSETDIIGIEGCTADSLRLTMADTGDTNKDSNFEIWKINTNFLKLDSEALYIKSIKYKNTFSKPKINNEIENMFFGLIINNINLAIKSYNNYKYRDCVKYGFYLMIDSKNKYISRCQLFGEPVNNNLLSYYVNNFLLINYPIVPHFCDYLYRYFNNQPIKTIFGQHCLHELKIDKILLFKNELIENIISDIRKYLNENKTKKKIVINIPEKTHPKWWNEIAELVKEAKNTQEIFGKLKSNKKNIEIASKIIKRKDIFLLDIEPIYEISELIIKLAKKIFNIDFEIAVSDKINPFEWILN